eukprot:jgi/Ulvmu1/3398/UM016_0014.1
MNTYTSRSKPSATATLCRPPTPLLPAAPSHPTRRTPLVRPTRGTRDLPGPASDPWHTGVRQDVLRLTLSTQRCVCFVRCCQGLVMLVAHQSHDLLPQSKSVLEWILDGARLTRHGCLSRTSVVGAARCSSSSAMQSAHHTCDLITPWLTGLSPPWRQCVVAESRYALVMLVAHPTFYLATQQPGGDSVWVPVLLHVHVLFCVGTVTVVIAQQVPPQLPLSWSRWRRCVWSECMPGTTAVRAPCECLSFQPDLLFCAESGALRLTGGAKSQDSSAQYGRLEVFTDGGWGTVCGHTMGRDYFFNYPAPFATNTFTDKSVQVACRQLGFADGSNLFLPQPNLAMEDRRIPVWVAGASCAGDEANLTACPGVVFGKHTSTCGRQDITSISCYSGPDPDRDGNLRLAKGESGPGYEYGRLEIFIRGFWSSVCDVHGFTPDSAQVACTILGYDGGSAIDFRPAVSSIFSRTGDEVLAAGQHVGLHAVDCDGNETSLLQCTSGNYPVRECNIRSNVTDVTVLACANTSGAPCADCSPCWRPCWQRGFPVNVCWCSACLVRTADISVAELLKNYTAESARLHRLASTTLPVYNEACLQQCLSQQCVRHHVKFILCPTSTIQSRLHLPWHQPLWQHLLLRCMVHAHDEHQIAKMPAWGNGNGCPCTLSLLCTPAGLCCQCLFRSLCREVVSARHNFGVWTARIRFARKQRHTRPSISPPPPPQSPPQCM